MVGNVGQGFWSALQGAPESKGSNPIDRWTARVLAGLGDAVLFPFGGPPHHPFQRWARRADPSLSPSPLGILIHPEFGLWHALRGAVLFRERLKLPAASAGDTPCDGCATKPCLRTCPVGAFTARDYDTVACRSYLRTLSGQPCMIQGCQARLACPVGRGHGYRGGLAQHLMREFARG
jgi:ferredoxin